MKEENKKKMAEDKKKLGQHKLSPLWTKETHFKIVGN